MMKSSQPLLHRAIIGGDSNNTDKRMPSSSSKSSSTIDASSEHSTFSVDGANAAAASNGIVSAEASTNKPLAPKPKRCVTFSPVDHIELIPTIEEYTADEIDSVWFSKLEMIAIRSAARDVIQEANSGSISDMDERLFGLEGRIAMICQKRLALKNRAWDAVMDEQERQWDCFAEDEEEIARAYEKVSRDAAAVAFRVGRFQARNAQMQQ
eukprot:CAMPEP_0119562060 /NCGR_PEP_ID=MMETSP1352-20130426/19404_1 /TAXON_ID=265584 /ORGANISM="Stauroneis constricta, Strain CCMP1120" /LENGTH=209 /DNA_ID=CAMNT_0007610403 /DNA_START=440 /DNA_END=1069 /DNA_ORIENTATION=-